MSQPRVNCPECLKDNCKDCSSEWCLCRESHGNLCRQCKIKKATPKSILLDGFCSQYCKREYTLADIKHVLKAGHFSDSAKCETIEHYILHKTDRYSRILQNLDLKTKKAEIRFDVQDHPVIFHFFREDPESFHYIVKTAVLNAIHHTDNRKVYDHVNKILTVTIENNLKIKLNEWGAEFEGVPVEVECQVIGAAMPETYTKDAVAECPSCENRRKCRVLSKPPRCDNSDCDLKGKPMSIDWSTLKTGDYQVFQIQEPIEQVKHGMPTTIPCAVKDEYVKTTFVGQRKRLVGVFRSQIQERKTTNAILINAISLENLDDIEVTPPTPAEIENFKSVTQKEDFIDIITESIAPEIKHENLAKIAVLLGLVGGTRSGRLRGDIHVMLLGDPSVGKSTILEFVPYIIVKSGFANGSTMSGSGVTVSMDVMPNRQRMPRAGIIPLCTDGVVVIDEMNQLDEYDIAKMFESMESGTIHYNKGGFDLTLEARTTIIAGANPHNYEYDFDATMADNLKFMPPPMISRFDLIVNLLTSKTPKEEEEIADHIIAIREHGVEKYVQDHNLMTPKQLTSFLSYVRQQKPTIDKKASDLLKQFQLKMKQAEVSNRGMKRIDRRFFESMIRLATAWAKLHLSPTVTAEHAMTVIEIYKQTLKTFNIDVSSGVSVPRQDSLVTSKKNAFETALHRLQTVSDDKRFTETEAIDFIVTKYPSYFTSEHAVSKMFDDYYNKGKLGKSGGRYRLEL